MSLVTALQAWASDFPTITSPLPDLTVAQGASLVPIQLTNHFAITGITGQVVQFRTSMGTYNIETFASPAPVSVANLLNYANSGRYTNTIIHRSDKSLHVIQGGGYLLPNLGHIATFDPIVLEYGLPNIRGTISMARSTALNSATSEWFINTADNTTTLGQANGGGYAVFGRVTGTGMSVVDAIAALPVYTFNSPFNQLPLKDYTGTNDDALSKTIVINGAEVVPVFPAQAGQHAVVTFSVTNSNPLLVAATLNGSLLNLTPGFAQTGTAHLTVTGTDSNNNAVQSSFQLTITAATNSLGWVTHRSFGQLWDAGNNWYGGSAYGWLWFQNPGQWIWSSTLQGWLAATDINSRTLWSTQFRWLTPSATDPYQANTSAIGPIYLGQYLGAAVAEGWVVSDRFGYVWANGDGVWFWSQKLNTWLGVTPDGGIWSVNDGRFL